MANGPYTKRDRLADVLALIQVLALDRAAHRSEGAVGQGGIADELQGPPRSATTWYALAGEHPEFFRVNPGSEHGLSLAARHVLPRESGQPKATLPHEFTSVLLQTAITLHDRQVSRADFWKSLLPSLIAGALAIISGVSVALLAAHITHPAATNRFVGVQGITPGVLLDTTRGQYCWAGAEPRPSSTVQLPDCTNLR
jgi:hypothetical protein